MPRCAKLKLGKRSKGNSADLAESLAYCLFIENKFCTTLSCRDSLSWNRCYPEALGQDSRSLSFDSKFIILHQEHVSTLALSQKHWESERRVSSRCRSSRPSPHHITCITRTHIEGQVQSAVASDLGCSNMDSEGDKGVRAVWVQINTNA